MKPEPCSVQTPKTDNLTFPLISYGYYRFVKLNDLVWQAEVLWLWVQYTHSLSMWAQFQGLQECEGWLMIASGVNVQVEDMRHYLTHLTEHI